MRLDHLLSREKRKRGTAEGNRSGTGTVLRVDASGVALFGFEGAHLHLENPTGEEMQEKKSPCPHESASKGVFTNILGSEQNEDI